MRRMQLRATRMIAQKRHGQRDRDTDGHISSTGPPWGPLDPSVGKNNYLNLDLLPKKLSVVGFVFGINNM